MKPVFHFFHVVHIVYLYVDLLVTVVLLPHNAAGTADDHRTAGRRIFLAAEFLIGLFQHLHIGDAHGDTGFRKVMFGGIGNKGSHYHQLKVLGLFIAVGVIGHQAQREFVFLHVHKGRDRIAQRIGLPCPALTLAAVPAFAGVLESIPHVGAYQHRDLLLAQVQVIRNPAAALQLELHRLQRGHVHAITLVEIGLIPFIFARINAGVNFIG